MSFSQTQPWEVQLLIAAQEAFDTKRLLDSIQADSSELDRAYQQCEQITRYHSRTFYMASGLLPPDKRRAARALYAFCRITDDIVDDPARSENERKEALAAWREKVMSDDPTFESPVCLAWADTQVKFNIPRGYAQQLIDGCARDVGQTRYATFADLAAYSYGVASTVGLMAMHIVGFSGQKAIPYAVRLGVALQMTNILRDVKEDFDNGRIYLPQDELAEFGLSDSDIAAKRVTDKWQSFMVYQIERTRDLYAESIPGIAMLADDGRFAIAAAAELYEAILDDIEAHNYNVFDRRAHVGTLGKLIRMPGIWWRSWQVALD